MTTTAHDPQVDVRAEHAWVLVSGESQHADIVGESDLSLARKTARRGSAGALFDGVLHDRAELAASLGLAKSGTTDAGLVLEAYERWGIELVRHIEGTFALVVWDRAERRLLAVRDPLGTYPLFFAKGAAGRLLVAMSIDALIQHSDVDPALNRAALADHLCHRWPYPTETFYTAVKRVPPGCTLLATSSGTRIERYWDPVPPGDPVKWITESELDTFDARLDTAVARAMGEQRTGIFLSGGLDSISIAAVATDLARRAGRQAPVALSLGFSHPDCNEQAIQRGVAGSLGLPHDLVPFEEATPSGGLLAAALEYTRTAPAPMMNTWSPAYTELARRGRERGVQVILTGAGGDEWLTVSPYLAADLIRAGDLAGLSQLMTAWRRSYSFSPWRVLRGMLWTFGTRPLAGAALHGLAPGPWHANRLARLRRTTRPWIAPDPALRRDLDRRTEAALTPSAPPRGFYFHEVRASLDHPLTSMELEETFEMGRRLDVQFRHPYWDAGVVDMLYRTPPHLLIRDGRAKGLVRDTVARRFPALGLDRQKKIPATSFFRSLLHDEIPKLWQSSGGAPALGAMGIIDPRKAQAMVEESLAPSGSQDLIRVWDLLNVEAWVQSHTTSQKTTTRGQDV